MAYILRKENHRRLEKGWRARKSKSFSGPPINRNTAPYQDPRSCHVSKHGLLKLVIGINTGLLLTSCVTLTGLHKYLMLHKHFNFIHKMGKHFTFHQVLILGLNTDTYKAEAVPNIQKTSKQQLQKIVFIKSIDYSLFLLCGLWNILPQRPKFFPA